ncbi:MAG: hypothetical protein JNK87_39515 [Bryobacterales bacterium]|nr:hypothetical protein [Bryobacterales bacterium]
MRIHTAFLISATVARLWAGKDWGVEKVSHVDAVTGATVVELTAKGKSSNLYFHFPNFTADNRYLIFGNDRTGRMELYRVAVPGGEIVQLTDEEGVAAGSACPDPTDARRVYFVKKGAVWSLDVESFSQKKVAEVQGKGLGQPSLSGDGKTMAVGFQVDEGTWEVGVIEVASGKYRRVVRQGFRIGHVQHSPTDAVIFYVWETGGYAPQRTWIVKADGSGNRPLYASTESSKWVTPLKEWVTHEAWVPATGEMTMILDKVGILLVDVRGKWRMVAKGWYWHAASTVDGKRLIADDFEGRLWVVDVRTGEAKLLATGLREARGIHLHASWDRTGRWVIFNYTHEGKQRLGMIEVK